MNTPKQTEAGEERYRLWKEQHVCWVRKAVIRSGLLHCSCGFQQAIDGAESAYKAKAAHLKATMPQPELSGAQIGHWLFQHGGTKSKKHATWILRCVLCGFETRCVDFVGNIRPLTGALSRRRRKHDTEGHPETLIEQENAENAILARTGFIIGVSKSFHTVMRNDIIQKS